MSEKLYQPGVEGRLKAMRGVHRAEANPGSDSVTVEGDETAITAKKLRRHIEGCGFGCRGAVVPPPPPFGLRLDLWLFGLAMLAVVWPSWSFLVASLRALRNNIRNMAVLVVLSVGTGYLVSGGSTFFFPGVQFCEAVAVLLVFILLGHCLKMRARAWVSAAIRSLPDVSPPMATVVRDDREVEIPTGEVRLGEAVAIRPGNKSPVDTEIAEGSSPVDGSMLTDEPMPVVKAVGDQLTGATINKGGTFRYRVTEVGTDTAVTQVVKLVQEAQNSKAPAQRLADRVSQWPGLIAIAAAVRPTVRDTAARLRQNGIKVAMLTGDNEGSERQIADQLGISIVLADVLPGQKADKVKELPSQGKKVGMVGSGGGQCAFAQAHAPCGVFAWHRLQASIRFGARIGMTQLHKQSTQSQIRRLKWLGKRRSGLPSTATA